MPGHQAVWGLHSRLHVRTYLYMPLNAAGLVPSCAVLASRWTNSILWCNDLVTCHRRLSNLMGSARWLQLRGIQRRRIRPALLHLGAAFTFGCLRYEVQIAPTHACPMLLQCMIGRWVTVLVKPNIQARCPISSFDVPLSILRPCMVKRRNCFPCKLT